MLARCQHLYQRSFYYSQDLFTIISFKAKYVQEKSRGIQQYAVVSLHRSGIY